MESEVEIWKVYKLRMGIPLVNWGNCFNGIISLVISTSNGVVRLGVHHSHLTKEWTTEIPKDLLPKSHHYPTFNAGIFDA
jgi:hypothetical protein